MNKNKKILAALVLIELCAVFFLLARIQSLKKSRILSVNVLGKQSVRKNTKSNFKFFKELVPNSSESLHQTMIEENKWINYSTNYDGLNDTKDYFTDKTRGVYRIITLGDSFTFGLNVSTPDNYSEVLEEKLASNTICGKYPQYEVLNLGVPGYDVIYGLERFRLQGQKYNPDLVIWYLKDDDFFEPEEQIQEKMRKWGIDINKDYSQPYDRALSEITNKDGIQKIIERQAQAMESIRDYYKKKLIILTHAKREDVLDKFNDFVEKDTDAFLLSINYSEGQTFTDGHPNELGHRYIADIIYNYLLEKGYVICE